MTDESQKALSELLGRAKGGDGAAFDALLLQYMPLIERQLSLARTRRQALTLEDEKDLRQEAHLAFFRAIVNYDVDQHEVSFGLYAKICVENGVISALRKMRPSAVSLESEALAVARAIPSEDDPTRRLREAEDYQALCRMIARTLSPYENEIWQRYIAGETAAGIARRLGRDVRSIHNAIYRIRNKLRSVEGIDSLGRA